MPFNLTNKNISDTFQNLLQKTGSEGHLYDLVGNQVHNLTIGGTLTAHSYVTSESIVNTSSGSTAFGNTFDDSHTFIGNITASGNIKADGWISASSGVSEFENVLTTGFRIRRPQIGTVHSVIETHSDRGPSGDVMFSIPGDISASGTVYGKDAYFTNDIIASGNIKADGWISASGNLSIEGSINIGSSVPNETFLLIPPLMGTLSSTTNKLHSRGGLLYWGEEFLSSGSTIDAILNVVDDLTPQLGGHLELNSNNITGSGNVNIIGHISASAMLINQAEEVLTDFFLIKSGSLDALKVNKEGVMVLGGFLDEPTPAAGGIYYHGGDDEFYAGKVG